MSTPAAASSTGDPQVAPVAPDTDIYTDAPAELRSTVTAAPQTRAMTVEKGTIDEDAQTVELSFSSEEPYRRHYGMEILGHKKNEVNLDRLNTAGCVLVDHYGDQVGTIDRAWIAEGKGRAILRFSKSVRGREIFRDIVDGIRKNISVGYQVLKMMLVSKGDENTLAAYRVTSWLPHEISVVGIPADTSVGVGRSIPAPSLPQPAASAEAPKPTRSATMSAPTAPAGIDPADLQRQLDAAKTAITTGSARAAEIVSLGQRFNCLELAVKAINDPAVSVADFKGQILERQGAKPVATSPELGMSEKEVRSYSLTKAIMETANARNIGGLTGLEREGHEAMAKLTGRSTEGFLVPHDVQTRSIMGRVNERAMAAIRTLQATVASTGGYTVGTDVLGGSMIETLNNMTTLVQLGARTLTGLVGNVAIPKVAGGATVYWLAEGVETTASNQTFGSIGLTPKRLAGRVNFSRQLLAQSSIDVEAFVRGDLMTRLAIEKDRVGILGTGAAGEPKGILNTTGVNSVTFGAAATWAKVISFETLVAEDNALLGAPGYLTSPGVKGVWKAAPKVSNTAVFLWEAGDLVNGYRAMATNQITGNKVIFGNFADLIFGDWAGIEIIVDPLTRAANGEIVVNAHLMTDIAIRNAVSFAVSSDSGAQ